jgi:outer membrane protein TolC
MAGNMIKVLILLAFLSVSWHSLASSEFQLSEQSLKQIADKGAPQIDQIEALFLSAELQSNQTKEIFAPVLFGSGAYSETNEKPILQFIPIWSPLKQAQVGLRQTFKKGFSAEASVITDQRSATSPTGKYQNITSTTLSLTLQMDLWKDLLGRLSEAKLETSNLDAKRASIEKEIQTKSFLIGLRKIYWALIANQESINISEASVKITEKQAEDTRRRYKNSVAEVDEVARNDAQVASKKSILLYYKYQKENLLKQLKILVPELTDSEIVIAPYDIVKTFDSVTTCTGVIAQESKVPYHFTQYDEATNLLRKVREQASILNSRYADPDVKLYGRLKETGVGSRDAGNDTFKGSYGASVDDMQDNNRRGYEVGVNLTIPLGSAKDNTQKTKELYDQKRLTAGIDANDSLVINTHMQLVKSLTLLNEVIRAQKLNTQELQKRLKYTLTKYQQARVSVNDLIQDEDDLLRVSLTTVETQLQVLNVLFDYLAIYTETPCAFNRI